MYNKVSEFEVLATEYRQRAFDGKWEKVIKVFDLDNIYSYVNEYGNNATLIPEKWICVDVLDEQPVEKEAV